MDWVSDKDNLSVVRPVKNILNVEKNIVDIVIKETVKNFKVKSKLEELDDITYNLDVLPTPIVVKERIRKKDMPDKEILRDVDIPMDLEDVPFWVDIRGMV